MVGTTATNNVSLPGLISKGARSGQVRDPYFDTAVVHGSLTLNSDVSLPATTFNSVMTAQGGSANIGNVSMTFSVINDHVLCSFGGFTYTGATGVTAVYAASNVPAGFAPSTTQYMAVPMQVSNQLQIGYLTISPSGVMQWQLVTGNGDLVGTCALYPQALCWFLGSA